MDRAALERGILGGILLAPDTLYDVEEVLDKACFTGSRARVWSCMMELHRRSEPIDLLSLKAELERTTNAPGIAVAIATLTGEGVSAGFIRGHARRLRAQNTLDGLVEVGSNVQQLALDARPEGEEVDGVLDECMAQMFALSGNGHTRRQRSLGEELGEAFARFERAKDHHLVGLSTGIYRLDDRLGGLKPGHLIIIAARPSMGKSALATTLAVNAATSCAHESGKEARVLLFSLEMSTQQLVTRLIASDSGVDSMKLMSGRFSQEDALRAKESCERIAKMQIDIDDGPDQTVHRIRGRARRHIAQAGVDLIIIDYIQLIRSGMKSESRQVEIATISRGLKMLAKELQVPVIVLAQLSRAVERRDDKRPMLADLRESGALEQDADVVLFLFREHIYNTSAPPDRAELIIAKNREGALAKVDLRFRPELTRFDNLDDGLTFAPEPIV